MASVLNSERILTVADFYHTRFVRRAPLTRPNPEMIAEVIEIERSKRGPPAAKEG